MNGRLPFRYPTSKSPLQIVALTAVGKVCGQEISRYQEKVTCSSDSMTRTSVCIISDVGMIENFVHVDGCLSSGCAHRHIQSVPNQLFPYSVGHIVFVEQMLPTPFHRADKKVDGQADRWAERQGD